MNIAIELALTAEPPFSDSTLPVSAAALYGHSEELEGIVAAFEPDAEYMSSLDAVLAVLRPDLRDDVLAYYDDEGPALEHLFEGEALAWLDQWLSDAIELCIDITAATEGDPENLRDYVQRFVDGER